MSRTETNRPFRVFDFDRDIKSVERIWREVGWIDDEDNDREAMAIVFRNGETEVATINDEAECSVLWMPGTLQYQDESLPHGIVAAVTTSHIARRQGFARDLTARSLARQREAGMAVSSLGIFDQGFYDKLGYGTGPYEHWIQFDPDTLSVNAPFRVPKRLTVDDYEQVHRAMSNRKQSHGSVVISPPEFMKAEMKWTEKPYGLGYFDGEDGSLSHFIWGSMKGENGPYRITFRAYQNNEQLLELLALVKSLGDQVSSFTMVEFGEFQLQDLLRLPMRTIRNSRGSDHQQQLRSIAHWQLRILDLETCLAHTHLNTPGLRFNLRLSDPLDELLEGTWRGLSGDYVIDLGAESSCVKGSEKQLPTLQASINAFSRMWLGSRPASHLAITDDFSGDEALIKALDNTLRLPEPHPGWDY